MNMEFQCTICKTKVELGKEQLAKIYELSEGIPTVAELCDDISRLKRKTCGKNGEGEKKKLHVFIITDKERDLIDPMTKENKEIFDKISGITPELMKTTERIKMLEVELGLLREKETGLNKTEEELNHKRDGLRADFLEVYGHKEIELWS
jgi:FtsZ-binding cell division protein ZapB